MALFFSYLEAQSGKLQGLLPAGRGAQNGGEQAAGEAQEFRGNVRDRRILQETDRRLTPFTIIAAIAHIY